MSDQEERLLELERSTRFAQRFAVTMSMIALALVTGLGAWLLSRPDLPASETSRLRPRDASLVDVLLLDGVAMSPLEIQDMVRPILMVLSVRLPASPQHVRIVVSPVGFPVGFVGDGVGVAGYSKEADVFVVDLSLVRGIKAFASEQGRWAFVMAHEATHLWQGVRGDLAGRPSNWDDHEAYRRDVLEREAFQEGLAVANALGGDPVRWVFSDGREVRATEPNPYRSAQIEGFPLIRTRTQVTPRGLLLGVGRRVTQWTDELSAMRP